MTSGQQEHPYHHLDNLERLTRLEVYAEVSRKDSMELIRRLDRLEAKLSSLDDDIKAAKVGGKIAWFLGGIIIAVLSAIGGSKLLPFLNGLPR